MECGNIEVIKDIIKIAIEKLATSHISEPQEEARTLFLATFSLELSDYLMFVNKTLETLPVENVTKFYEIYKERIELRCKHIPIQHLLGKTYFYGLELSCDHRALIPRPDTEILVEEVLKSSFRENANLLDVCTGSGCIALVLATSNRFGKIFASDISLEALSLAKENLREYLTRENQAAGTNKKTEVYLFQSDMFQSLKSKMFEYNIEALDVIVSNPPYIKKADIKELDIEVSHYDPYIALDGGEDGLDFYKILAGEAKNYLRSGGKVFFEIGYNQGKEVKDILVREAYENIKVIKDYSNNDRVVIANKK